MSDTSFKTLQPEFEHLAEKKLVGISLEMSLAHNLTHELFSTFMPRRQEIPNALNTFVYALQVYPKAYFMKFEPSRRFKKYALIEVADYDKVPEQMEQFTLPEGGYAVFTQRGKDAGFEVFDYIFTKWLPNSKYLLDDRPHFEKIIGNKDKSDTDISELIYIPVRPKN
ncbi:GyrI-like domain-containing protein [Muriicola sp. Z0-33]|uniref:GyrI-like domain-containing protein n=1 Tax=Muriicola sp. Z0-33 TaxID=2816957 RepID=UPI002237863D|nr:GyrI-like domain-containing protein [Muriicola sp. Z0-33]MCW5517648.1 GyrI-like domain-containing protein [Muriicola sp. Z0-33]